MNILEGDSVSQLAHVGWGLGLTLLCAKLGMHHPQFIVFGLAFIKEAIELSNLCPWEPPDSFYGSATDLAFWCVGILAAGV